VNAELLLRDIRTAHAELVSRLDRADPARWNGTQSTSAPGPAAAPAERATSELDIPEFVPRPRSRRRR
jgi:hypothetical protein